jgi:methionyl-tRNA formyltransferase
VRVAFLGLPLGAILLERDGHDIVWAGICRAEAAGTRRLSRLVGPSRVQVVPDLDTDAAFEGLRNACPALLVSWFWTKKVPPRILRIAPSFGVHPSLLPRHRGPDPYFSAIDAGDETSGVTAHLLDDEYDTGAILAQCSLPIDPAWDAWRLARALDRPGLRVLRRVARAFAEGHRPEARVQDEGRATLAPSPTDEELAIRWSWTAARIERRVRAAAPWPGAWTEIGGAIVSLLRVRTTLSFPRVLTPGEAVVRADGVAIVRAGDAAVELLEGRSEDDEPMSARDFAALVRAQNLPNLPDLPNLEGCK